MAKVRVSSAGHEMLTLRGLRLGVRGPSRSTVEGEYACTCGGAGIHCPLQPRGRSGATAAGGPRRRQKGLATLRTRKGWHQHTEDPIPRGRRSSRCRAPATLHITKLPKARHAAAEWQATAEALSWSRREAVTAILRVSAS